MFASKNKKELERDIELLKAENAHLLENEKRYQFRVESLNKQLAEERHHNRRSALVEKANLPPCKSVACYNCKFCTFLYHPTNGAVYLLGCGKNIPCDSFLFTSQSKPPMKKRWYAVTYRTEFETEDLEDYLAGLCLQVPQPPCHADE